MNFKTIKKQSQEEIKEAINFQELESWRIKYLGRKSALSLFFDSLKALSPEERKKSGKEANELREYFFSLFQKKEKELKKEKFPPQSLDITRPGEKIKKGHLHPLTLVFNEIIRAFEKMGFELIEGLEIETEYYNFDALRIPAGHPARDMWDTLWVKPKTKSQKSKLLLRAHTSPMQIRYMEKHQPPLRIIVPGKCFRHEATDASHDIQFHQIEGLMVGENISFGNFKAAIKEIIKEIFKNKVEIRFRPSYFPFVSPGVEADIKVTSNKKEKWLEIMGAGMVHPDLLKTVGYESNRWQGFAFGLGVERIAMIKYKINDIRLFFNSDLRFLEQF